MWCCMIRTETLSVWLTGKNPEIAEGPVSNEAFTLFYEVYFRRTATHIFLTGTIPCFLQLLFIIPENCDRIMYGFKRKNKKQTKIL